jgi:myxalamid-type polyketide synthase MxaB
VSEKDKNRWDALGVGRIAPEDGPHALQLALEMNAVQLAILPVNWETYLRQVPSGREPSLLSAIVNELRDSNDNRTIARDNIDFMQMVREVHAEDRRQLVLEHVKEQLIRVFGLKARTNIDVNQEFGDLGMDSLMAVEISNRLKRSFGGSLSSTIAFEYSTLNGLTDYILLVVLKNEFHQKENNMRSEALTLLNRIDDLSDDQVNELLNKISVENGEKNLG